MEFNKVLESLLCVEDKDKRIYKGFKRVRKMVKIYLRRIVREVVVEYWLRKFLVLIVYFLLSFLDVFRILREYIFLERFTLIFEEMEI